MGRLHRRPCWPDGSSRRRPVHGAGLLHRPAADLEPDQARGRPGDRRRADPALRLPSRAAEPVLRQQHEGLGPRLRGQAPGVHDGPGEPVPHQHVHEESRLRVHRAPRVREGLQDADPRGARRQPAAPLQGRDGSGDAVAQLAGHALSLEGHARARALGSAPHQDVPGGAPPPALGRLFGLEPQLLDRLFAHHELLDLAGDGHRELRHELDVARDLVVGDLALAEGADLLVGRGLAGMQLDPGADRLAEARVGHANHLHVQHLRMPVEELLDLARIDVLAAADDHVLEAADDVDVALLVHRREVAGVHPAGLVDGLLRLGLVVPVALHHRVAAGAELACLAARHHAALGIDDLDLDMGKHLAHRRDPALDRIVGGALRRHG